MRLKDWFKSTDQLHGTPRSSADSLQSRVRTVSKETPWNKMNIRKWRDQFYNAEVFLSSPLNLTRDSARTVSLPPLEWFNFKSAPYTAKIINTGHTTVVKGTWYKGKKKPYLTGGPLLDQRYVYYHSHFHWGESEHAAHGETFPMEVHSVFFNVRYKTYENALKECDGIVIVAKFCRLLPETALRTQASPNMNVFTNVSVRIEDKGCFKDEIKQLKLTPETLDIIQFREHKVNVLDATKSRIPILVTANEDKRSYFSQKATQTGNISSEKLSSQLVNDFIGEIAKNIRYVSTVNTSKLIHAYSLDQLLPQFSENYFFYLSGIRRQQITHRVTWIIEDRNHLFITKAQLKSFQILRRVGQNSRRIKPEFNSSGNMFYIVKQANNNTQRNNNNTLIIIHENLKKISTIAEEIKCDISTDSLTKNQPYLLDNETVQTDQNNEAEKVLMHLKSVRSKRDGVSVSTDDSIIQNENGLKMARKSDYVLNVSEPSLSSNSQLTDSTRRNEVMSFNEFYHEYFYEKCRGVFMDIVKSINFNIEIPYCSTVESFESTSNNLSGMSSENCHYSDQKDSETENLKRALSFILINKINLSCTFEKLLENLRPRKMLELKPRNMNQNIPNKVSPIVREANKYKLKGKYTLRKKQHTGLSPSIMSIVINQPSINVSNIINDINETESAPKHNDSNVDIVYLRQRSSELQTDNSECYIDSSIFEPLSIPSFSKDLKNELTCTRSIHEKCLKIDKDYVEVPIENDLTDHQTTNSECYIDSNIFEPLFIPSFSKDLENELKCIRSFDEKCSEIDKDHFELKLPVDSKIPRPKNWTTESRRPSAKTPPQETLATEFKQPTKIKAPSTAPPNTNRAKVPVRQAIAKTGPCTEQAHDRRPNGPWTKEQTELDQNSCQHKNDRFAKSNRFYLRKKEENSTDDRFKTTERPAPTMMKTNKDTVKAEVKFKVVDISSSSNQNAIAKMRRAQAFARKYKLKPKKEQR